MAVAADRATMDSSRRPLDARWSWSALVVSACLAAAVVSVDVEPARTVLRLVTVTAALSLAVLGARRHLAPPLLRRSVYVLAVGTLGNQYVQELAVPRGSSSDAPAAAWMVVLMTATLLSFAGNVTFAASMVRRAAPRAQIELWSDALVVAVGTGLAAWVFVLPDGTTGDARSLGIVALICVTVEAMVVGLTVQLTVRRVGRVPAFWMLLAGHLVVMATLAAMAVVAVQTAPGVRSHTVDLLGMLAACSIGVTCLHRSIAVMGDRCEDSPAQAGPLRLLASYGSLIAPTLVLLESRSDPTAESRVRTIVYVLLVSAVFIRMVVASARLRRLQVATRHRADHDDLTGLLNRAGTLAALRERAQGRADLHLLFVDLDRFKHVNDTWGHAAGDSVLRQVADRLRDAAGRGAAVGRMGGDEFVIGSHEEPTALAARLRSVFDAPFARPDGRPLAVTGSIGVATARDGDVDVLVGDADVAMYAAKSAARGSIRHFDERDRRRLSDAEHLRQELEGALGRGELSVHLQPLVAVDGGSTDGYEALLRWSSPTRGPVSPAEFVPVADDAGLMEDIGSWVLQESCAHLARLRAQTAQPLFVSVNLTARELSSPRLVSSVVAALDLHAVPGECLWLELTESSSVRETEAVQQNVEALRARGVVIALDDFGTGFASLTRLHDLDFQVVKIDRSFVAAIGDVRTGEPIVRSLVAMSRALGLTIVAEGVETAEQAERLTDLGVDVLQGFWCGRPADVTAWTTPADAPRSRSLPAA